MPFYFRDCIFYAPKCMRPGRDRTIGLELKTVLDREGHGTREPRAVGMGQAALV